MAGRRRRGRRRRRGLGRRWRDFIRARVRPDLLLDATIAAAAVLIAYVLFASLIVGPMRAVEVADGPTATVVPLGAVIFGLVDALPDPRKNACSA